MIVEILFFILIILIVILFLCIRKVYTGGFLPKSAAAVAAGNPDDNSIVFFEMSSMIDINKYIDIVTYKNLIKDHETLNANYENDRLKADIVDKTNSREYITIRDCFKINPDLTYECYKDFKWGNSAFNFICRRSKIYTKSVEQNLKTIINDNNLGDTINNDRHPGDCDDNKCVYCLTNDNDLKYLIYLYDAYVNDEKNNEINIELKKNFEETAKNLYEILYPNLDKLPSVDGTSYLGNDLNDKTAGGVENLIYSILLYYLCNNINININLFNTYNNICINYFAKDRIPIIEEYYKNNFNIIKKYFILSNNGNPNEFFDSIIEKMNEIRNMINKYITYRSIINDINIILYYNLSLKYPNTFSKIGGDIAEYIAKDDIDNTKFKNNDIHTDILLLLFIISANTLFDKINNDKNKYVYDYVTINGIIKKNLKAVNKDSNFEISNKKILLSNTLEKLPNKYSDGSAINDEAFRFLISSTSGQTRKIKNILKPEIQKAIKYFEADDRLILLEGTLNNPELGFRENIQKTYYDKNINTFHFMRQTLIIYPDSFLEYDKKITADGKNTFTTKCTNKYDKYRVKNDDNDGDCYEITVKYSTYKCDDQGEIIPDQIDERSFDINFVQQKRIISNVMALPFIPIFSDEIDLHINVNDKKSEIVHKFIDNNDKLDIFVSDYINMNHPYTPVNIMNIIKFICEYNIRFVLYVGLGEKGKFILPKYTCENIEKIFNDNITPTDVPYKLDPNLTNYVEYCNRLFSIIPRFFSAITDNAFYVNNKDSKDIIDNFIINVQRDSVLKNDKIKIIDKKETTNDGTDVTIMMNITGAPKKFTVYNYNDILDEKIYEELPLDYLINTPDPDALEMFIYKLKVTKNNNSQITEKFTYIGTNQPTDDEEIIIIKREPKQIYGGPQTSEFSFPAQISQQKSTPIEYSLCYSPEEYKTSEENFSCLVKEFNLSSSSEYISSPAINESDYAICYTNNDSSSEKMQYYTFEEMQSLCDSTGILYSTKLFAVESSEPVDDYERIRISQELHKLDQNIPEIKMPKDLKILKHDINKKNKIRIKKVIRGLNGKVLSIDDVHTIYINIE